MTTLINAIVCYCIQNQIILPGQETWFRYGLEKRISGIYVLLPCAILALILSDLWTASSFLVSFYYLRSRTGGYHAHTPFLCLCSSILLLLLFFLVLLPILNTTLIIVLIVISLIIVFVLAPINHPNMHLSRDEYQACKQCSHKRVLKLSASTLILNYFGVFSCARGIALGCTLVSLLICLAHFKTEDS